MARQAQDLDVRTAQEGVVLKVSSLPLLFDSAQPLIPIIAEIIAIASAEIAKLLEGDIKLNPKADVMDSRVLLSLLPGMKGLSAFLGDDGRLEKLAPKILATTRVAAPNHEGDVEWYELFKIKDRSYIFDEYPEIYLPTLYHAGRTTFGRFFPVRDPKGSKTHGP